MIARGTIWWASLPESVGSTLGCRRPVVVLQADEFNASRINTVLAVALTSNLRLAAAPGNVLIPARVSGLPHDSVANVSQIFTLDKTLLTEEVGPLPPSLLRRIADGLRLVLDL